MDRICPHVCMHVCMVCMYVCIYIDDDVFYILLLLVKICGMVHFGAPTMFVVCLFVILGLIMNAKQKNLLPRNFVV